MMPLGVLASARRATGGGSSFGFLAGYQSAADAPTAWTLTGATLGAESADRVIIVAAVCQTTITSLTIGGVSATLDVQHAGGSSTRAWIGHASVPTGATGDVVVTFAAQSTRHGLGLWRASGGTLSLVGSGTGNALNLTVSAGDAVVCSRFATAATDWTGVVEDYDAIMEGGNMHSGASIVASSGGTVSPRSSGTQFAQAVAVFRLT